MTEEPLMHTKKGNLPVKDLTITNIWAEDDQSITHTTEYRLGDELVRNDVAICLKSALIEVNLQEGF